MKLVASLFLLGHLGLSNSTSSEHSINPRAVQFEVQSRDGTTISGQIDLPSDSPSAVILLVAGTGPFDRDVTFGSSKSDDDKIFLSIARLLSQRGFAVVRYDKRGIRYKRGPSIPKIDADVVATTSAETQVEDLAAVLGYARSNLPNTQCLGILGHSEGVLTIGRLAETSIGPPNFWIGIGAPMRSAQQILKWQLTNRDAYSLTIMDANEDGITTNEEVKSGLNETPSGVYRTVTPYLHPNGRWESDDLERLVDAQSAVYENLRDTALKQDDNAPYPDKTSPVSSFGWWKSWFTDETVNANRLARWSIPAALHYGSKDSQTPPAFEGVAALQNLDSDITLRVHTGLGHSLGEDVLLGPIHNQAMHSLLADIDDMANKCME